jgi:hypothetical protein
MAIASSGAVSLGNLQTEFGGANPISIDEYYLNGIYVSSNNTGVPTSGTISLQDFYGASANTLVTVTEAGATWTQNITNGRIARGFAINRVADTRNTGWFNVGSFGSITPTTVSGATIEGIHLSTVSSPSENGSYFYIICQGSLPSNHFSTVAISGIGTYPYSSFAFYTSSGSSVWKLTISTSNTNYSYTGWDGSGSSTVFFT